MTPAQHIGFDVLRFFVLYTKSFVSSCIFSSLTSRTDETVDRTALAGKHILLAKDNDLDAGMNGHISKPIDRNKLIPTLAKCL